MDTTETEYGVQNNTEASRYLLVSLPRVGGHIQHTPQYSVPLQTQSRFRASSARSTSNKDNTQLAQKPPQPDRKQSHAVHVIKVAGGTTEV